jgi:lipoprotein
MKIKTLIKAGLWGMATLVLAACASEDTIEKNEQKQTEPRVVASFSGQFAAPTSQAKTRTTGKHVFHTDMKAEWSTGDRIWVKDINGTWNRSEPAEFLTADHSRANFKLLSGNYGFNPEVRYVGASADPNQIIIPQTQSQTTLGEFGHLGVSGDCGTTTAKGGGGDYEFELEHKAAYICFYPRIQNDALHHNVRLEQILIQEMYVNPLGGWFDFSNKSIKDKTPFASNTAAITLNTNSAPIPSATRNDTCFYIAIRPGSWLTLSISFTIKDPTTNVTTTITHANWWTGNFEAGKIYDYTAWLDKDIKNYSKKYYMWDAAENYWKGHEADEPTVKGPAANPTYPQNPSDSRWYNPVAFPASATHTPTKNLPNANAMTWYTRYGDMHWETQTVWALNGHLYKGGVWVKTSAKLLSEGHFSTTVAVDGVTDLRTHNAFYNYQYQHTGTGRPTNLADYFFWPAISYYLHGQLWDPGQHCYIWTSTAAPNHSGEQSAYYLDFQSVSKIAHMFVGTRKIFGFPADDTIFK